MADAEVVNDHELSKSTGLAAVLQAEDDITFTHLLDFVAALDDASTEATSRNEAKCIVTSKLFAEKQFVRLVNSNGDHLDQDLVRADLARWRRVCSDGQRRQRQLILKVLRKVRRVLAITIEVDALLALDYRPVLAGESAAGDGNRLHSGAAVEQVIDVAAETLGIFVGSVAGWHRGHRGGDGARETQSRLRSRRRRVVTARRSA